METLTPLLDWIGAHPTWAGVLVFLVAFSESLALVGLFMPGAVLMFGFGALIGTGTVEFLPVAIWASTGAIAGDSVSFWLGRRFHQRLRVIWPFRTHPTLMARATDFFYRHGGKSILLARFIGPIRPVIPAVAGMLEMPTRRFLLMNALSGALWAPAYLLPGMLFAASLSLAAEVATRLAILLGVLAALLFLLVWTTRRLFNVFHARAHGMIRRVLEWSYLHPVMGKVPAALLDPEHKEARGLSLLALLLILSGLFFLAISRMIGDQGLLWHLDSSVFHALQGLRTPGMDRIMVMVTELGDAVVLGSLFAVILAWLAWQRRWHAAGHWLGAAAFSLLLTQTFRLVTHLAPAAPLGGEIAGATFPSAHTTHSTIVYGFLAVLIARELSDARRWIPYALGSALVGSIAFSRLYLGAHWLSGVLGGLALGLAWVALLGIAYRRHPAAALSVRGLTLAAALAVAVTGTWTVTGNLQRDLAEYTLAAEPVAQQTLVWWNDGWRELPTYRADVRGEHNHPFTVQYAGSLQRLTALLEEHGWHSPPGLDAYSWMRWFSGEKTLAKMPILPQVHDGRNEDLLLVSEGETPGQLIALRLWRSNTRLQPQDEPLWIGNVSYLVQTNVMGMIDVPRTADEFDAPLERLASQLTAVHMRLMKRKEIEQKRHWKGRVLLVKGYPSLKDTAQ